VTGIVIVDGCVNECETVNIVILLVKLVCYIVHTTLKFNIVKNATNRRFELCFINIFVQLSSETTNVDDVHLRY